VSKIAAAIEDMKIIQIKVDHINMIFSYYYEYCFDFPYLAYLIQFSWIQKSFVKAIKPATSDEVRGGSVLEAERGSTLSSTMLHL